MTQYDSSHLFEARINLGRAERERDAAVEEVEALRGVLATRDAQLKKAQQDTNLLRDILATRTPHLPLVLVGVGGFLAGGIATFFLGG